MDHRDAEIAQLRSRLERHERRSRAVMLGGALLAGVFVLGGADEPTKVLVADRIEIGEAAELVLDVAEEGPTVTLSSPDGRKTRLSLAGLEVTARAAQPAERPTLEDPGLGEEDEKPTGNPVTFDVGTDVYVSHIEVTCPSGYRIRSQFVRGHAVVDIPSELTQCRAVFGGGLTATRLMVEPGDHLQCSRINGSAALTCRKDK